MEPTPLRQVAVLARRHTTLMTGRLFAVQEGRTFLHGFVFWQRPIPLSTLAVQPTAVGERPRWRARGG